MLRNSLKKSKIGILKAFSFISGKKSIDTSDLETMLNTVSLLIQHRFKFEDGIYTII